MQVDNTTAEDAYEVNMVTASAEKGTMGVNTCYSTNLTLQYKYKPVSTLHLGIKVHFLAQLISIIYNLKFRVSTQKLPIYTTILVHNNIKLFRCTSLWFRV